MTRKSPANPPRPIPEQGRLLPREGGSYIRRADGSLERTAAPAPNRTTASPAAPDQQEV